MGRVQDLITEALAAEITRREKWDEMPEVMPVYLRGGRCHLGRLAIPREVWEAGPAAAVLGSLADCAADRARLLQSAAPGQLHGMAFFSEIWMASAPLGTAAAEDLERRSAAVGYRVSKLEDRVEARSIWAVDRAGITYSVVQARGGVEVMRDVAYPKAGARVPAGAVPGALDRLVTAFLGVTLPGRGEATWRA